MENNLEQQPQREVRIVKTPVTAWAIAGFIWSLVPFLQILSILACLQALDKVKKKSFRGRELAIAGLIISFTILVPVIVFALSAYLNDHTAAEALRRFFLFYFN